MLRNKLTYANVVATLALLFAMSGGAYAASKILIKSLNQISPSVQKKLKAPGAAGKEGKQGPAGPTGPTGPAGGPGTAGTPGTNGQSVTTAAASNAECATGGVKVTSVSGSTPVCTGAKGEPGAEGNIKATLPTGKSERGSWVAASASETPAILGGVAATSISFNIPLATAPAWHIIRAGTEATSDPSGCTGTVTAEPKAEPGNLCIFVAVEENAAPESEFRGYKAFSPETGETENPVSTDGVVFGPQAANPSKPVYAFGVWVVTAS